MASQAAASAFNGNMKKALAGLKRINLEGLRWRVLDAKGQVLGRLASQISTVIQGKDKPTYAPYRDDGDICVVLNANDVCVTGRKMTDKFYRWHTGQVYRTPQGKEFKRSDGQGPYRSDPKSCSAYASKKQIA
ncbi:hypothetical protein NC651_018288 [Populus alba x Populus x berolinensis]|nr:hypothetical protein NC651_018288 [Populus alba x Populus x berolinensis]